MTKALLLLLAADFLETPRLGLVRAEDGSVRMIMGVAGNFLKGPQWMDGVVSVAFTGRVAMMKTDGEILVLNASGEIVRTEQAPPGPAVFSFHEDGSEAGVHFAGSGVVAAGPSSVVMRRGDELWLVEPGSDRRLEEASEPVLFLPDGRLLFRRGQDVVLRNRGGQEEQIAAPLTVERLSLMGRNWVHAVAGKVHRTLRLEGDSPKWFELPRP